MLQDKPNYYAVIPATVRYDKELSPNAKLLYAEITSLANSMGFCWATNSYFSDLYGVSDRQIRNLLKQLLDKKYISIIVENNTKRKIFLMDNHTKKIGDTPEKNFLGGRKNISTPLEKNFLHNNKINNKNEYNNNIKIFDYDWLNEN